MAEIIRSLIIVLVISCSSGGIYYYFHPTLVDFCKATIGIFCLQIIFFFFYNNILRFFAAIKLNQQMLTYAQLAEKNKIIIECEGCKKANNVDIDLTRENTFECTRCGADNKVQIEISTILPTKIIYDK